MIICSSISQSRYTMKPIRKVVTIGLLILPIVHTACKHQKKTSENKQSTTTVKAVEKKISPNYPQILATLQSGIKRLTITDDSVSKKRFVEECWDSSSGSFFCLGKGVINTKLPQSAQLKSREKAAELIALKWALYLKKWKNGEYISMHDTVNGQIIYSTSLYKEVIGDTLFSLVTVPLGSIIGE